MTLGPWRYLTNVEELEQEPMARYRFGASVPGALTIASLPLDGEGIDAAAVDAAVREVATDEGDTSVELWDRRGVRVSASLPVSVTADMKHWRNGMFVAPSDVLDVTVEATSAADAGSVYLRGFRDWIFPFGGLSMRVKLPADVVTDEKHWVLIEEVKR